MVPRDVQDMMEAFLAKMGADLSYKDFKGNMVPVPSEGNTGSLQSGALTLSH